MYWSPGVLVGLRLAALAHCIVVDRIQSLILVLMGPKLQIDSLLVQ